MIRKIKLLADEAIKFQNKNRMDEVLREISEMCGDEAAYLDEQNKAIFSEPFIKADGSKGQHQAIPVDEPGTSDAPAAVEPTPDKHVSAKKHGGKK